MKDTNDERIAAYLRKELSDEALKQFEHDLKQDKILAEEYNFRKTIVDHIELLEDRRMLDQVSAIHHIELKKKQRGSIIRMINYLVVAASIALLFAVAWQWLLPTPAAEPGELYAQYHTVYDLNFGNRSDKDALAEAGGYYIARDFEKAAPIFEDLLQQNPNLSKVKFALAISQMELDQWNEAILLLEQLIANNDVLYADNARWYLSLCLLKLDKITATKTQLNKLAAIEGAQFQSEAKDLLNVLE